MTNVRRRGREMLRQAAVFISRGVAKKRPNAVARPPWERSLLDDVAMRRPWNLLLAAARLRARVRVRSLHEGVTVVIVSWNTRGVLADVLRAVQRFTPTEVRVMVIDNGSTDGSREMLRAWPGIRTVPLPSNAGHGAALDLGVFLARTSIVVTLDSDAIPLREGWLDSAVEPVRSGRAVLAGLRSSRNFVHPVYLAVDTETFIKRRLSFQVHRLPGVSEADARWGENAWDTGELMTPRLDPADVVFVERTENVVGGLPGMTAAGVVYHHGGVSRSADGGVTAEALQEWRSACRALGLWFVDDPARTHETGEKVVRLE